MQIGHACAKELRNVPARKAPPQLGMTRKRFLSPMQPTGMRTMTRLRAKLHLFVLAGAALAPLAADAADLYRAPPTPSYAPPAAYVDLIDVQK